MLLQKMIAVFLAILSFFASYSNKSWGDKYVEGAFPQIGVTEKEKGTVRVCSFNVRDKDVNDVEMKDRVQLVVRKILEIDPDSFGVQEATAAWMKALVFMLPDYGHIGKDTEGDGTGETNAIFYKRARYKLCGGDTKWLSDTPDETSYGWDAKCKRLFTYAVLKNRRTGEEYVHVNSHFDHVGQLAREKEAEQIVAFVRDLLPDRAVVFTADMNATDSSEAYRTMTSCFADARKTAPDSEWVSCTFHGGRSELLDDYIIDYVLYNEKVEAKAFRVVTTGIDGRFVSDHFPIYADVEIKN